MKRLQEDPSPAERVAHYQAQKLALQALFPLPVAKPALLLEYRTPWWRSAVIGLSGVAAGLVLGIILSQSPLWEGRQPPFALRADAAYSVYAPEQSHPVEVASTDQVQLFDWLSRRLGRPLSAPLLHEYGYELIGGRLLPGDSGPAAQFMYQNDKGNRLALYITVFDKKELTPHAVHNGGRGTYYWVSHGLGYALSGRGNEQRLGEIALDVCNALGGKVETWKG
jgi:anti-sigma factor RsiW